MMSVMSRSMFYLLDVTLNQGFHTPITSLVNKKFRLKI